MESFNGLRLGSIFQTMMFLTFLSSYRSILIRALCLLAIVVQVLWYYEGKFSQCGIDDNDASSYLLLYDFYPKHVSTRLVFLWKISYILLIQLHTWRLTGGDQSDYLIFKMVNFNSLNWSFQSCRFAFSSSFQDLHQTSVQVELIFRVEHKKQKTIFWDCLHRFGKGISLFSKDLF